MRQFFSKGDLRPDQQTNKKEGSQTRPLLIWLIAHQPTSWQLPFWTLLISCRSTKKCGFFVAGEPLDVHFYPLMWLLMLKWEHCIYSSSNNLPKQIECKYKAKKMAPTIIPDRFKSLLSSELGSGPTLRYEGHFESPGFVWQGLSPDPPILTLPQPPSPPVWVNGEPRNGEEILHVTPPTYLCPNNWGPSHHS